MNSSIEIHYVDTAHYCSRPRSVATTSMSSSVGVLHQVLHLAVDCGSSESRLQVHRIGKHRIMYMFFCFCNYEFVDVFFSTLTVLYVKFVVLSWTSTIQNEIFNYDFVDVFISMVEFCSMFAPATPRILERKARTPLNSAPCRLRPPLRKLFKNTKNCSMARRKNGLVLFWEVFHEGFCSMAAPATPRKLEYKIENTVEICSMSTSATLTQALSRVLRVPSARKKVRSTTVTFRDLFTS